MVPATMPNSPDSSARQERKSSASAHNPLAAAGAAQSVAEVRLARVIPCVHTPFLLNRTVGKALD